jgi:hypothetical protein
MGVRVRPVGWQLESVRDFPLFDGDFFAEALPQVLYKPTHAGGRDEPLDAVPTPKRQNSRAVAEEVKSEVKKQRAYFLVANLNATQRGEPATAVATTAEAVGEAAAEAEEEKATISNDLVDSRAQLLGTMQDRHWQWDELRRAHYSTMMMLANMGGPP